MRICEFASAGLHRLSAYFLVLVAVSVSTNTSRAQAPIVTPDEPITLPETVVIGELDSFPSQPLTDDQVVSPGRSASLASQFGGSVSVITREQIDRTRQRSVGEVLRHTVGLDVARTGGPGGPTSIFLRGGNSAHTKVLIDGAPVNDPSNANRLYDFSNLSVDNIERIEVLRGPQSMAYGSDAMGGVINIITRRGDGTPTLVSRTDGGTLGSWTQSLSYSGGDDVSYYSLAGSFHHNDGVTSAARRFGNTERDRFRQGNVSGRFGWNLNENANVDYTFRFVDGETAVDDFGVDNLSRYVVGNQFYNRVQLQTRHIDGLIVQKFGASLSDAFRRDTDPEPFFGVPRFDGQSRQLDWQAQALLYDTNTLVAGADYYHEEASSTFNAQRSQFNKGVYIEDRFQIGERWMHTIGARWDDHSTAGSANTYRYTTRYELFETFATLHGSIGTGFRAPSIAEKLFPGGNTLLDPETSKGWDVGVRQQLTETAWVDATVFRTDYNNLIEFDFITFMSQNIGRARASGVELTSGFDLNDATTLLVSYTFNDTRDLAFGGTLPRRPQQKGSLTLNRRFWDDQASVTLYALYVGDRLDFAQRFGGLRLDDYWLVNLSASVDLTECSRLYARIDNVLDEDYEEAGGFDVPGINGVVGLEFQR